MRVSLGSNSIAFLFRRAIFLCVASTLLAVPAGAYCPRLKIHVNNEFFKSRFVVIGEVLSERTELDSDGYIAASNYRVTVLRTYRGSHQQVLTIRSENDSGRFPMDKGQRYLLFVRSFDGHLRVDSCGNSDLLSNSEATIHVIDHIPTSGPYGEIEARVISSGQTSSLSGQAALVNEVPGIRLVANGAAGTFSAVTNNEGFAKLRVPPGVYRVTVHSRRFSLAPYALNEDKPGRLVVHRGASVQLDYDACVNTR